MTIKQAKSELMQIYGALSPDKQRAIDTLVKIEPCEDAIRRADAEALFRNARSKLNPSDYKTADEFNTRDLMLLNAEQFIHLLPSVNPQEPKYCDRNICIKNEYNGIGCDECEVTKSQEPKTGHWMHDGSYWKYRFICSECNYRLLDKPTNYCPNCGAKMESEV